MEAMGPDSESRDSPTLITTIEDCPKMKKLSPSPVKIKTEPSGTSTSMPIARRKITISAEEFERLKARNVLSVKSVKSDVQDLDVSNEGVSIPFEAKDTFLIKVEPNCPIRMVNIAGVLQIEAVEDGGRRSALKFPDLSGVKQKMTSTNGRPRSLSSVKPVAQAFKEIQPKRSKKNTLCTNHLPPNNTIFNEVASHLQSSFPSLQVRKLILGQYDEITVVEITRRQANVSGPDVAGLDITGTYWETGTISGAPRTIAQVLLFTQSLKAELRVLGTEEPLISKIIKKDSRIDFEEFDNVLLRLSQNYTYCVGIPNDEFEDECTLAVLRRLPEYVVKSDCRYRSVACLRYFDWTDSGGATFCHGGVEVKLEDAEIRDRCPSCWEALQKARKPSNNQVDIFHVREPSDGDFSDALELLSMEELKSGVKSVIRKTVLLVARKRRLQLIAEKASSAVKKEEDARKSEKETKVVKRTFKCTVCTRKFRDPSLLVAHKLKHKRKFICPVCQKGFYTKTILKGHERIHGTERPHKCAVCDKGFLGAFQLKQHARVHTGEKQFKCQDCDKAFCSNGGLKSHRLSRHLEKQHICEYCAKPFAMASSLNVHISIHTGDKPYECRYCGWRFIQRGNLEKHESTHVKGILCRGKLTCSTCSKIFANADLLKEHVLTHSSNETPFKCRLCPLEFRNVRQKNLHECCHGGKFRCKRVKGPPDKNERFQCNVCLKTFSQHGYLTIHRRIHTGDKPYKCEQCPKAFAQSCGLNTHRMSRHMKVTPHKCPQCGKSFGSLSVLRNHLLVHTGEKPFKCRYCEATFRQKGQRSIHECLHTGIKRHACDHCEKKFIQRNDLVNHIRTHTGEKPFKCNYCEASFAQKNTVKIHERQHTDERPYTCDKCSKKFRQKCTLRQHLEQVH